MLVKHKETIDQLKQRLLTELGNKINSIILYGSVARNEAQEESDIDILLIIENEDICDSILEMSCEIDLENGTATSHVYMTPGRLNRYINLGSPFIESVITEGITLYDDGTFEGIRRKVLAIS